jgi:hypothetical protein
MTSHGDLAIVDRFGYDHSQPFTLIEHDPGASGHSGYGVLTDEALELPEIPDERLITVCLHCLINRHPDLGAGLDLARQTGRAIRNGGDGEWT